MFTTIYQITLVWTTFIRSLVTVEEWMKMELATHTCRNMMNQLWKWSLKHSRELHSRWPSHLRTPSCPSRTKYTALKVSHAPVWDITRLKSTAQIQILKLFQRLVDGSTPETNYYYTTILWNSVCIYMCWL